MILSFYPDAERAQALDARMRTELACSLESVVAQFKSGSSKLKFDSYADLLEPALSLLRSPQRVSPALFAGYYQLVQSILNGQDDFAEEIGFIVSMAEPRGRFTFKDLSVAGLGSQSLVSLYRSCLDTDERMKIDFLSPDPGESLGTRESVIKALLLIHKSVPDIAAEFEALVSEIVFAKASSDPDALRFDGGSSYMLWGALALSVNEQKSDLEMMETLVHEAAHLFLFGLTLEETLVNNKDDDLYQSPLRPDSRPMDGIYHATFVSARMHYALKKARYSDWLNSEQMMECEALLKASENAFNEGYSIVMDKGSLTRTGRAIMNNAFEFMQKNAFSLGQTHTLP